MKLNIYILQDGNYKEVDPLNMSHVPHVGEYFIIGAHYYLVDEIYSSENGVYLFLKDKKELNVLATNRHVYLT